MAISVEEKNIISEILQLAENETTQMLPEVMEGTSVKYADPERYAKEVGTLFRNFPIIIGHAKDLAEPGDFITQDIAGAPALVTRTPSGEVKAYLNICRHRGARVETRDCGKARTFSCPYHAWTYDLDGKLRGMPQPAGFSDVDKADLGLTELPAFIHLGLVWVVPSPQAQPIDIARWTACFNDYLGGLNLGDHYIYKRWTVPLNMNWRIALEGFQESYHFCSAHRETACSGYLNNQSVFLNFTPHVRHAVPIPKVLELRDQDPDQWQYRPYFMDQNYLFPANFVQVMTDHVYIHTITPTGPDSCVFQCMMLLNEAPSSDKAERYWARNYEVIRTVFNEDFTIGESIQRGLKSGIEQRFVIGRYECGVQFGHKAIDDAVAGKLTV